MYPGTRTLTIDWDGKSSLEKLVGAELTAGWKEVKRTFDPAARKAKFEFKRLFPIDYVPEPDSGNPDDYYDDWMDNEQYFEYDGDAKSTWYKGQRIS